MASITVRNLDDVLKNRLRVRAAEHGRSMEEEVRCIIRDAVEGERILTLVDIAREIFGPEHGIDLELPPGVETPEPPKFD